MKRFKKTFNRNPKQNARRATKSSKLLNYQALEERQVLTVAGVGFSAIGATLGQAGVTAQLPNAEGDVSASHFVEVGEQTFSVFLRTGEGEAEQVLSTSLNQFFLNAGADLFGESLEAPRIIYDRAIDRWIVAATGDGNGTFAGNRIHIAVSQTSDPAGQFQSLNFVADITGQLTHSNVSLGVDADAVYLATQNFDDSGDFIDVSIYSIPKDDVIAENPTNFALSRFDNLSIFEFGESIQFASNFEASDGFIRAFSAVTVDLNAGTGLPPNPVLTPGTLNAFRIEGAAGLGATLTTPVQLVVDSGELEGPFVEPDPLIQASTDGSTAIPLGVPSGLNAGLIEADGSVFGAQTVGFDFGMSLIEQRSNGINWFEIDVIGADPVDPDDLVVLQTETVLDRNPFVDAAFNTNLIPDPLGLTEQGAIEFFNPSIGISDAGLVALTFNGTLNFDAVSTGVLDLETVVTPGTGAAFDPTDFRVSSFVAVGLRVQGSIQLAPFDVLNQSTADDAFDQGPGGSLFGRFSSVRPDPSNPNALFSVIPHQVSSVNNDGYTVALTEILPIELAPALVGTGGVDEVIVSLDPDDTEFVEIFFDGELEDRFESELLDTISIDGGVGNDIFIVDYSNGDPTPAGGFIFTGGAGFDTLETFTTDNVEFNVLDQTFDISDFTVVTDNGVEIPADEQIVNMFSQFETLVAGSGNDLFNFVSGTLAGDVNGEAGDDLFVFSGILRTGGSVNGGTGFNTLDLEARTDETDIVLFSPGANAGFNGRTIDGPVGDFADVLDQFRDISLILGSTVNNSDSIQSLAQSSATFTLQAPDLSELSDIPLVTDEFVASSLEQAGASFFFTNFELLTGSVVDDVFNVQSNDGVAIPFFELEGSAGDDTFNFSSDSPGNSTGVLEGIGGLFEVDGGTGANSLVVSDAGRFGPEEFLVLGARISGPVEVIFFSEGSFDVTLFGSDNTAPDTFFLQSFLDQNTLTVFGLGGDDTFVIQDLSQADVIVAGGEGDDDYIIEQVSGIDNRDVQIIDSVDAENDQAILAGTLLDEVFIVDVDSFLSENFVFTGIEEFGFDGRGGNDQFYVRAIDEEFPVILRGGTGDDTFFLSSDAPTNLGDLSTFNNNLTIEDADGSNQILISNESGAATEVEIFNDQIVGLFNGLLNYTGLFDLIDIVGSNGGDDTFVITSFLAGSTLQIDGRLGEDEFVVGNEDGLSDIQGDIVLDGGSDGDTYTLFLASLDGQEVTLADSGFSGSDVLDLRATEGNDTISLSEFEILAGDQSVAINEFFETILINALGGADNLTLLNAPTETVIFDGGDENDVFNITGSVGVDDLQILGGAGNDLFLLTGISEQTTALADGGVGVDNFSVGAGAVGDLELVGGADSDSYTVALASTGNRQIIITDSDTEDETHELIVNGDNNVQSVTVGNTAVVDGNGEISFAAGTFDSVDINAFGGNDSIGVSSADFVLDISAGAGNDQITLASDVAGFGGNVDGITGPVNVDGGSGLNQLSISNATGAAAEVTVTSSAIVGLTAEPIVFSGQFALPGSVIGGIQILGSDGGDDIFNIDSLNPNSSLAILGLGGDDVFNINNTFSGDGLFDGGEGSDTYNFEFGSTAVREIVINDTGVTGTDTLNLIGSDGDDDIVLDTDSVSDAFTDLTFNIPLGDIEIFALGGNDTFTVNGAPTERVTLYGGIGEDTFVVNGTAGITNLDLQGGVGNDDFFINSSSGTTRITADGFDGNDLFRVGTGATGVILVDGQQGSDTTEVLLGADGERRVDTRDSGTDGGQDSTTVIGSSAAERLAVRTTRFLINDEVIVFDEDTESVTANTGAGNDRIVVFGSRSQLTEVFAGGGSDVFVINGGAAADVINLSGQGGNDVFNVNRTSAGTTNNLFGNGGNDRFNVGSTINADDGNLGLIRGELNIVGGGNSGGGEDSLFANDNGANLGFSYLVTPTSISAIPGPQNLPREIFNGINFDASIEFVRLDGTPAANLIEVIPSQTTRFFFDGNSPSGTVGDQLNVLFQGEDGRNLTITDPVAGNGFVSFTNGAEVIQFQDIELATLETSPAAFQFANVDFDDFFSTDDMSDFEDFDF